MSPSSLSPTPFNQPITTATTHPDSDTYIRSIGQASPLRCGFGYHEEDGSPMGVVIRIVPAEQKKSPVKFDFDSDSVDVIQYPMIDALASIKESTYGERIILLCPAEKTDYELFTVKKTGDNWSAVSGIAFDLTDSQPRESGKKGACSSGLPVLAGLIKVDEVKAGKIEHAMLFSVSKPRMGWISPATSFAGHDKDIKHPPMGLRLRLKADFDMKHLTPTAKIIAKALQTYGMLIADKGHDMELWGEASDWWKEADMDSLRHIKADDFEAVDTGPIRTR